MYAGIWDTVSSALSEFGISGDSALAAAKALASPTLANINAVTAAFSAEGNTPPPELMNVLWERYYQSTVTNPYAISGNLANFFSSPLVWLIGGGILIYAVSSKKRGA
jgi:hypothetical protein